MKKIIAFILCCVLAFASVSCAAETSEIIPEYIGEIVGDLDLDEKTFVFGVVADYFFEGEDNTLSYINNTEFGDLAMERIRSVEKTHNCSIEFQYVPRAGEAAYKDVYANDYTFDVIQEESYWLVSYIPMGIFVDLTTLDHIDVTDEEKWGNRELLLSTMWKGAVYGIIPAKHPLRMQNSVAGIIGINETHVQSIGEVDPRDYYENGEWSWDTFTRVLNDYTLTSLGGDKIYAFACDDNRFPRSVAFSNGDKYITINEDGTYQHGLYTPTTLEALNQYYEWITGPTADNILFQQGLPALIDGNAVLGNLDAWEVLANTDSLAYNLENFGLVPYPHGPEAEPGWYQTYNESTDFTLCIPVTSPDPEATAFVLDKIYEPFEGYETRDDIIDYLYANYFLDKRDAVFFYDIANAEHTYFFPTMDGMFDVWTYFPTSRPTEALEKAENVQFSGIEEHILPRLETIPAVYGE